MADTDEITSRVEEATISGSVTSTDMEVESDPIFKASPASKITDDDVENLNNLSGINSGDETDSTIKSKLGISTLLGDNTGDKLSYTLHANCASLGTPIASSTYYYGSSGTTPTANNDRCRIYFPKAGKIKVAVVHCWMNTAPSAESWSYYVRINNTTDYLISSVADTARNKIWANYSLDINVNIGDYFEIKFVTPAWVTVPTTLIFNTIVYIEP